MAIFRVKVNVWGNMSMAAREAALRNDILKLYCPALQSIKGK